MRILRPPVGDSPSRAWRVRGKVNALALVPLALHHRCAGTTISACVAYSSQRSNAMTDSSWRRLLRLICLVLMLPAVYGCFEYAEVIRIKADGSGTVEINASVPEAVAATYRVGSFSGQVPPPVSEGIVQKLMVGSRGVNISACDIELEGGVWKYNVFIDFDNVRSLAQTKYFKQRNLSLHFSSAKELHFRQDIYPSLVQMAADEAKTTAFKEYPYSKPFLAAVEAPDFKDVVANAKIRYSVVVPGIRILSGFDGDTDILSDGLISAGKDYKITDFMQANIKQLMDFRTVLPEERGFTPLVIALLLASIVGILVPAIRLLLIKARGAA